MALECTRRHAWQLLGALGGALLLTLVRWELCLLWIPPGVVRDWVWRLLFRHTPFREWLGL